MRTSQEGSIEAKRFPGAKSAVSGACGLDRRRVGCLQVCAFLARRSDPMSSAAVFSQAPQKQGCVVDAATARPLRVISFQYNSDSLSRTLQGQTTGGDPGNRIEPVRFKGPAVETSSSTPTSTPPTSSNFPTRTERPVRHPAAARVTRIAGQPTAAQLSAVDREASSGTLEIAPMLAPLALFVWSKSRIVPVKVTDRASPRRPSTRPESDPRQGQSRPARAVDRRPRLLDRRRQPVHGLPAKQGAAGGQGARPALASLGIGGIG